MSDPGPENAGESDWRSDPEWRLVGWDATVFPRKPGNRPLPDAELAQPPTWASLYRDNRLAATWARDKA